MPGPDDCVIGSYSVYSKEDIATDDEVRRFETEKLLLSHAVVRAEVNAQLLGNCSGQPFEVYYKLQELLIDCFPRQNCKPS